MDTPSIHSIQIDSLCERSGDKLSDSYTLHNTENTHPATGRKSWDAPSPQTPPCATAPTFGGNLQLPASPWGGKGLDHTSSTPNSMASTQGLCTQITELREPTGSSFTRPTGLQPIKRQLLNRYTSIFCSCLLPPQTLCRSLLPPASPTSKIQDQTASKVDSARHLKKS